MSAFFAAATVTILFSITKHVVAKLQIDRNPSKTPLPRSVFPWKDSVDYMDMFVLVATVVSVAFSRTFFQHAIVSEVYSLNTFLVVLVIWLLLAHADRCLHRRMVSLLAFFLGLGLGNHHTLLLIVPALAVGLARKFKQHASEGTSTQPIMAFFFFLLGCSVYLYLPLRSAQNPPLDWAHARYFDNFIYSLLRQGYRSGTPHFFKTTETLLEHLRSINLIAEFGVVGVIIGGFGLYKLFKVKHEYFTALLVFFFSYSVLIVLMAGDFDGELEILQPFYLPAYLSFGVLFGIGIVIIMETLRSRIKMRVAFPVTLLVLIVAVSGEIKGSLAHTKRNDFLAIDYGINKLNSMDEGALYFAKTDTDGFSLWYLQIVEKYRSDIDVIPVYFLGEKWYFNDAMRYAGQAIYRNKDAFHNIRSAMVGAITANHQSRRDIYAGFYDEEFIPPEIRTMPKGITFRLSTNNVFSNESPWRYYRLRSLMPISRKTDFLTRGVLEDYASAYYNLGLARYGKGEIDRALEAFAMSSRIDPNDPDSLNNLAHIYSERETNLVEAETMAKQAIILYEDEREKANARDTLAWIYYGAGRFEEAYDELVRAEEHMTGNPSYHYHRGMVAFRRGESAEARSHLSKAVNGVGSDKYNEIITVLRSFDAEEER